MGLNTLKPKFRVEINRDMITIYWNMETWKKLESLYERNGLRKSNRSRVFNTVQSREVDVYVYQRENTPRPRVIRVGDIIIEILDDIDDSRIIVFQDHKYVIINLAIFRVIPNSNMVASLEFEPSNIFIPNYKNTSISTLMLAIKTAFNEFIKDIVKIRYKISIEAY